MGNAGSTPLHKAANEKDFRKVQQEVTKKPGTVNQQEGQMGWTPLHVASYRGSDPIVRELLLRGAKPDIQDKDGRTALHLASLGGYTEVARALLRKGARTDVRDKEGASAYDYAIQKHPAVASLLGGPPPPGPGSQAPASTTAAGPSLPGYSSGPSPSLPTSPLAGAAGSDLLTTTSSTYAVLPTAPSAPAIVQGATSFPRIVHYDPNIPSAQGPTAPAAPTSADTYAYPQQPSGTPAFTPYPSAPAYAQQPYPSAAAGTAPYYDAAAAAATAPPMPYTYGGGPTGPSATAPAQPSYTPYPTVPGLPYDEPQSSAQPVIGGYGTGDSGGGGWGALPTAPPPPPPQPRPQPPPAQATAAAPPMPRPPPPPQPPLPQQHSDGGGAVAGQPQQPPPTEDDGGWGEPAPTTDWGDEPDVRPVVPPPRRPGFNPVASARFQLEKLLGAGLQTLAHIGGAVAHEVQQRMSQSQGQGQYGQGQGPQGLQGYGQSGSGASGGGGGGGHAASAPPSAGGGGGGGASLASAPSQSSVAAAVSVGGCRTYTYDELRAATGGFSPLNLLGQGGYGRVYRGALDGIPVAVKVMDTDDGALQGLDEFEAEAAILSRLHHPHIVLLIGICPEKGILVYELMTNSSLEAHLFGGGAGAGGAGLGAGAAPRPPLPWRERVRIAAEVASALLFLHSAPTPIVHMDLKPANILLDEHLTSKLGDVGLARLAPGRALQQQGKSTVRDSRLVGTFDYMDPEYLRSGEYSARSDVYALGMVLLQLLTGREGAQVVTLVESARQQPLSFASCIDPRAGPWPAAEAQAFADLALRCVALRRQDRPDLRPVILPTLMQLKQRTMLYEEQQPQRRPADPVPLPLGGGGGEAEAVPPMFLCPITQDLMDDPVVAADGYTYERLAIEEWVKRSSTSPLTNMPLPHSQLVTNLVLRSAIREWSEQQARRRQQQQQQQQQGPGAGAGAGRAAQQRAGW